MTIVSRLTAPLPSAIASIGVHGPHAIPLVWSLLRGVRRTKEPQIGRIHWARWPLLSDQVAEEVVVCAVSPTTVEIHCHGGVAVSQAILEALVHAGCQIVEPQLWQGIVRQAAGASHDRLSQLAEQCLIQAKSDRCAGILLDQCAGALSIALQNVRQYLMKGQASEAKNLLEHLLGWRRLGTHLVKPWRVALAGPPNVGKSSLLNALAGHQQALVHQQAGTTRDWIEVETLVAGWPVCLVDTAGIRSTQDPIEQEGVRRAQSQLDLADLVVLVVDSTVGWTPQHASIAQSLASQNTTGNCLVVYNKSDLRDIPLKVAPAQLPSVSCSSHHSMDPLLQAIAKLLVPCCPPAGAAIVFTEELSQLVENLLSQLERPADFWNLERLEYWLDADRWEVLGS